MTREDLQMCKALPAQIESCRERILRARLYAESVTSASQWTGGSRGSRKTDRHAETLARLEAWETDCASRIEAYQEHLEQVREAFSGLAEEDRALMEMRYIDGHTWDTVGERLYMHRDTCKRRHDRIIGALVIAHILEA